MPTLLHNKYAGFSQHMTATLLGARLMLSCLQLSGKRIWMTLDDIDNSTCVHMFIRQRETREAI